MLTLVGMVGFYIEVRRVAFYFPTWCFLVITVAGKV